MIAKLGRAEKLPELSALLGPGPEQQQSEDVLQANFSLLAAEWGAVRVQ
jgi:hypothetical protein